MGVDIASVNSMLSIIFAGRDVNDFTLNGELKPVYVQGDAPFRMQPRRPRTTGMPATATGEMVPFSAFTRTNGSSGAPHAGALQRARAPFRSTARRRRASAPATR